MIQVLDWIRTFGNKYPADVDGQGQRKSGQLCLVLVRTDRQKTDRFFLKIRTPNRIETYRIRTADRHRTGFSGK